MLCQNFCIALFREKSSIIALILILRFKLLKPCMVGNAKKFLYVKRSLRKIGCNQLDVDYLFKTVVLPNVTNVNNSGIWRLGAGISNSARFSRQMLQKAMRLLD